MRRILRCDGRRPQQDMRHSVTPTVLRRRFRLFMREVFFLRSASFPDPVQAKEEWIGRTETKQFHFVICVPAPFKGSEARTFERRFARCARDTDSELRDETAEKTGSSSRAVDGLRRACRENETPVSLFPR